MDSHHRCRCDAFIYHYSATLDFQAETPRLSQVVGITLIILNLYSYDISIYILTDIEHFWNSVGMGGLDPPPKSKKPIIFQTFIPISPLARGVQ